MVPHALDCGFSEEHRASIQIAHGGGYCFHPAILVVLVGTLHPQSVRVRLGDNARPEALVTFGDSTAFTQF